jgi:hypothetical protein
MLDLAHVGRLRVAIEELPHRLAGVVTGLGEGLSHETIGGRGAARDDRASGPPAHAGCWALPSLLLHIKRCLLDWSDSGPGKPGATQHCKEKGAPRHPAALPKPENLDGEMPRKSAAELEVECLRLLAMDPHTQGIKRVEIIRLYPKGTGPNRTYGALDPMPTRAGLLDPSTPKLVNDLLRSRLLCDFHPCFGHGNYGFAILRNRSSLQQCRTLINVALAFFDRFIWHHVH